MDEKVLSASSPPLLLVPQTGIGYSTCMELIFEVRDAVEGGYRARALGHGIFTEADSWDELRANVMEAVSLHFEDAATQPRLVQIHYVEDGLILLKAEQDCRAMYPRIT